jgi:hypothetical protein
LVTFQDAPDGSEANFGAVLGGFGDGRFIVGAPRAEVPLTIFQNTFAQDGGLAWFYDRLGQSPGFPSAPRNPLRRQYGNAVGGFPDGRVLVSTANSATGPGGTISLVGSVYLHATNGDVLAEWPNPDGPTNQGARFGQALAALAGQPVRRQFAERARQSLHLRCFAVGPPLVVITNPATAGVGNFGIALAAFGNDRLLVGDLYDSQVPGRYGSVRIYDLSGNLVRTIRNPVELDASQFGQTLAVVDDHRFLVGAPAADAVSFLSGHL